VTNSPGAIRTGGVELSSSDSFGKVAIAKDMSHRFTLLVAHLTLLVLASTNFTAITALRDGQFRWQYLQYTSQQGWGVPYQFPYSLPEVLCYVAAYGVGAAAYLLIYRGGSPMVGLAGVLLCIPGFASFSFESTHWLVDHYRSWIASAPLALLVLAPVAAIQVYRRRRQGILSSR
jgi:hypothetical protein